MSSDAAKNAYPLDPTNGRQRVIAVLERMAYDRGQSDLAPTREIVETIRYALVFIDSGTAEDDAFAWIDQFVTWDEMGG